jgi:hypothetical protein
LPFSLIKKKKNAQLISGKLDENHTTRQTPHGATPTHDTLKNNRAQTKNTTPIRQDDHSPPPERNAMTAMGGADMGRLKKEEEANLLRSPQH